MRVALICIFYIAWQRSVFGDIFAPVHGGDTSKRFLSARLCTANIFVLTKVRALAKCNLFQPAALTVNCWSSFFDIWNIFQKFSEIPTTFTFILWDNTPSILWNNLQKQSSKTHWKFAAAIYSLYFISPSSSN